MTFDFDANKQLSGKQSELNVLVQQCNQINGDFVVCETPRGYELLAEYSANVRKDVKVIYSNVTGQYSFGA